MVNPDFTEADFLKVRRAIRTVGPAEMSFTVFSPPPGTELWKKHRAEFCCPDPYGFYDGMHTLLPTRMPLKKFYRQLSRLWLFAARNSPLIRNKLKVPLKDRLRFFYSGFWYGYSVQHIYWITTGGGRSRARKRSKTTARVQMPNEACWRRPDDRSVSHWTRLVRHASSPTLGRRRRPGVPKTPSNLEVRPQPHFPCRRRGAQSL